MSVIVQNKNEIAEVRNNLESKKDLIKKLYCKNCTDDEFELFMHICQRTGLDPCNKQIYAIKLGGQMTTITGIDGLRLIAERTGKYCPGREPLFTYDEKGQLVSATTYFKKQTLDGTWHEFSSVAYLEEYNTGKGLWPKMRRTMLAKCSEAVGLRRGFPAEMSGLYIKDEMDQATTDQEPIETEYKARDPSQIITLQLPPPKKSFPVRTEITEKEWGDLEFMVSSIEDKEYLEKLAAFVNVPHLSQVDAKDYDRVIRSLENKMKAKEAPNAKATA